MVKNTIELQENTLTKDGSVKVKLLRILLTDPYFGMLKSIIKDDNYKVVFNCGSETIEYTISTIVKGYQMLLFDDSISEQESDRILALRELTSIDRFIAKYKDKEFSILMDNFAYKIKVKKIIEYLMLNDDDCYLFLNSYHDDLVSRECFLYATDMFLKTNNITAKYTLPTPMLRRVQNIANSRIVDIEAINQINTTTDCMLSDVYIDKNFENEIMRSIPNNLSQLETAIYVYILLCKKLTYDPIYFAYDQRGERTEFHKNPNYIHTINSKNNRVVCYEFNAIYGYLLNKLCINYENSCRKKENYSKHASLVFRCGKYIVSADSVTSIPAGDLVNAKIDRELNGLVCLNNNPDTVREFKAARDKVLAMFKTKPKESILHVLRDSVNCRKLPFDKKVEALVRKANDKRLDVVDTLGYILKAKREIFTDDELCKFSYIIVRYNNDEKLPLRAIFTICMNGEYKYFIYKPCGNIVPADKDTLDDMFILGDFEYLSHSTERVPGAHDTPEIDKGNTEVLGEYGALLKALAHHNISK